MAKRVYYYEDDNLKVKASTARYHFALPMVTGKRLIDIGCGARRGPQLLAGSAQKVIGADVSLDALRFCAKKWSRNNLFYIAADARRTPFKDNSFDCAVSFEVIEHIADFERYLGEVKRILKDGGDFMLSTPNRSVLSCDGRYTNPDHVREFIAAELKGILNRFFRDICVYGQSPAEKITAIELARKVRYEKVSRLPSFFKKIIPAALKEIMLKVYLWFSVKYFDRLDVAAIDEGDFIFSQDNIEKARYFVAVCKK